MPPRLTPLVYAVMAACTLSLRVAAQDAVIGPPLFPPGQPQPAAVPRLQDAKPPAYPESMADSTEIAYALVRLFVRPDLDWGFSVSATHPPVAQAVSAVAAKWQCTPAPREGAPLPVLWVPVIFNPKSAGGNRNDAIPRLLVVTPVIVPRNFLAQLDGPPVVRVRASIDPTGAVTDVALAAPVDGRLLPVLRAELPQWRFAPAREADRPVAATIELSVLLTGDGPSRYRFHAVRPAVADQSRPALPTFRMLALLPLGLRGLGLTPEVTADFDVDAEGVVHDPVIQSTNDPRFNAAALEAVRAWRFAPSLDAGRPIAQRKRLKVEFVAEEELKTLSAKQTRNVPPKPLKRASPIYPDSMWRSGISGEVTIDFVVDTSGNVKNAAVVRSNNKAFEEPALDAVRRWKFEPATVDGKAVPTHMQVPIVLTIDTSDLPKGPMVTQPTGRRELVQAAGLTPEAQKKLPPEFRYDTPPRFVQLARPVFPYALQRDGVSGKANVTFVVGRRGEVALLEIKGASRPEFGLALAAAVEASRFEPALREGQATQAIMRREQEFDFGRDNELLLERDARLLGIEQKKPERIVSADKLDGALTPILRRAPEFPLALLNKVDHGEAEIEFLIDEDGHARLPRIVRTSEPEFGYAAAQAISGWAFEPPKSASRPAIVRARQLFRFRSPPPAP